jgi:predicted  nucleic acid-binding Zn-ribbon protein
VSKLGINMNQGNFRIILLVLAFVSITSIISSNVALADVIPPKKQTKLGFTVEEVICKEGLIKVIKKSTGAAACVKPSTAEKLAQAGWSNAVDQKLVDALKTKFPPIGTVNILEKIKIPGNAGIQQTTPQTVGYQVIFEACANDISVRVPQVIISSDSEVKSIKLSDQIIHNTCQTSVAQIKASNPDSVMATLYNKGGVSKKINELESTVKTLQEQISTEKSNLALYVNQVPKPEDIKQKVAESSTKIVDLRKNLNNAKAELERYFFSLYVTTSSVSKGTAIQSFGGKSIEGGLVNILATTQQLSSTEKPFGYNVVFEACAGKDIIRTPLVQVTSDIETKIVKLSEKISPNSCQISTAKITANDKDGITAAFGNTGDLSSKVSELDSKIVELQQTIQAQKKALNELTHLAPRPSDFNEQAINISNKIIDLRNQINELKTQLHSILFGFYEN